jgi:hypothetical protein
MEENMVDTQIRADPLTFKDHTLIVRAVMEHAPEVIQKLGNIALSDTAILQAALLVEGIDDYTKERMKIVLGVLLIIKGVEGFISPSLRSIVDDVRKQITGQPVEQIPTIIRKLRDHYKDQEQLAKSLEVVAQIAEDGQSSIYSPDFPFYRLVHERKGTPIEKLRGNVADADTVGATFGALGGALAGAFLGSPLVGAEAGAIGGGAGASLGALAAEYL